MRITLSILKADVGSIGGHTKPSEGMMEATRRAVADAIDKKLLIDGYVSHTGDDIAMVVSHTAARTTTTSTSSPGGRSWTPRQSPRRAASTAQARTCSSTPRPATSAAQARQWRSWSSIMTP